MRKHFCTALFVALASASSLAAAPALAAAAQDSATEKRLTNVETELRAVRQELQKLREALVPATVVAAAPKAAPAPAAKAPVVVAAAKADGPSPARLARDAAEEAYMAGYRLWEQRKFPEAQKALETAARDYPGDMRASYARNLAGRAYLDEGKPAAAAKTFFANQQADPKGARAADSLYYLGQSLMQLGKPADACKAYDKLASVYGASMRDLLRQRLRSGRAAAGCDGPAANRAKDRLASVISTVRNAPAPGPAD